MEDLRRFRMMAVRLALMLTTVIGFITYAFDEPAGQGFLMGGVGGILAFWVMAKQLEKLAISANNRVKSKLYVWTFMRMALFAAILVKGYWLDKATLHGFVGAAAGLFVIRLVLTFLGATGFDLKGGKPPLAGPREKDDEIE